MVVIEDASRERFVASGASLAPLVVNMPVARSVLAIEVAPRKRSVASGASLAPLVTKKPSIDNNINKNEGVVALNEGVVALTGPNLNAHNADTEAKHAQVNGCVQNSLRILGIKTTTLMETIHVLQTGGYAGTELALAEVHCGQNGRATCQVAPRS